VVNFAAGVWTVAFQGLLANVDVPQITVQVNEIQRITNPVAGGALTLGFNGEVTAAIPGNSDGFQVQTALEALAGIDPGDVVVTGVAGGPWDVEFTGALANLNVNQIAVLATEIMSGGGPPIVTDIDGASVTVTELVKGANVVASELMRGGSLAIATTVPGAAAQNEQQTISFSPAPTSGNFTLTYDGQTTGTIPFNASGPAVRRLWKV
jgi:hypothetical protein